MEKKKFFCFKQEGFSLITDLIIIFLILTVGVLFYFFNPLEKGKTSKNEPADEKPVTIQAGVMTLPDLQPIIETKPEKLTNPSPTSPQPTKPVINTKPAPIVIVTKPQPEPIRNTVPKASKSINKKIFLVVYNPKVDGRFVTSRFGWGDPNSISDGVISFFSEVTNGRLRYTISKRATYETFPIKVDKFTYNADSYKKCVDSSNRSSDCHSPDTADYLEILKSTGACELANNGEIDELWIWGGPYFGFWESNVAGPKGFFVNSGPTVGSTCKKMLPIMGFNYERGVNEAVHNFGHRAESILKKVYGSWDPEPTHAWNRFSLLDKDKKGLAGCGNFHFAPNSVKDYEFNSRKTVKSNCFEFNNFPEINSNYKDINCEAWGCSEIGFYKYWWKNFPQNEGKSVDKTLKKEFSNNWLIYVFDFAWID